MTSEMEQDFGFSPEELQATGFSSLDQDEKERAEKLLRMLIEITSVDTIAVVAGVNLYTCHMAGIINKYVASQTEPFTLHEAPKEIQ